MSELTRGRSGRWLLIAMAMAFLIALTIVVTARNASGVGPETIREDAGVILVSTAPGDIWIRYYENPAEPLDVGDWDYQQEFTFNRCTVTGTQGDDLLTFTGLGDRGEVAIVSNGFGVKDKRNCSSSQGQVSDGQSLTIALDDRFFDSSISIDVAEVDVEGKHNAALDWVLDNDNAGTEPLTLSADNGPDNGASDNEIARVSDSNGFRAITFSANTDASSLAAVAIEGGGDGTVSAIVGDKRYELGVNQTLFHLQSSKTFEGTLKCGDFDTETGTTGEAAEKATVWRQENKGTCDSTDVILYNLEITDDAVIFEPNIGGRTDLNFLVQIEWAAHSDPFNAPPRFISFDGVNFAPVVACLYQSSEGTNPDLLDPDADDTFEHPLLDPTEPPHPDTNPEVPWCMAGERQVLLGAGEGWQQIQWYDGAIDPFFR